MTNDETTEDIPAEYYEAIGRVTNAWAQFEWEIDAMIAFAAGIAPTVSACMTTQMIGPNPRFRALASLVGLRPEAGQLLKAVNRMSAEMSALADKRNRLSHDPMFSVEDV